MLANGNQNKPKKVKGMRTLACKNRNENNEQDMIDKIKKNTIWLFEKTNLKFEQET